MNKALMSIGFAALTLLLWDAPVFGHHSFAAFDMQKTDTLSGVVREMQWTNPHCWIQMIVTDGAGNSVEWSIETSSPSSLVRQGWKPKTLKTGDRITISMHPLRDGRPGGSLVAVTLPDGTRIGASPTGESPSTRQDNR